MILRKRGYYGSEKETKNICDHYRDRDRRSCRYICCADVDLTDGDCG